MAVKGALEGNKSYESDRERLRQVGPMGTHCAEQLPVRIEFLSDVAE